MEKIFEKISRQTKKKKNLKLRYTVKHSIKFKAVQYAYP